VALVAGVLAVEYTPKALVNDKAFIDALNAEDAMTWRAGRNAHFEGWTMEQAAVLCGVKPSNIKLNMKTPTQLSRDIPTAFDSRDEWGMTCSSLYEIRDQSACGSCWAHGAAEAMTDRYCIHSNGTTTPHISAQDLNSCCASCGDGCGGGDPGAAFNYWVTQGIVDGGNYSMGGCSPYTLPPCAHHEFNSTYKPCPTQEYNTPACKKTCGNGATWTNSKHFGASAYNVQQSVADIQQEIMENGPVEAAFDVYQDFLTYEYGVYRYTTGPFVGGHAVKIIGWGVWEDGTPYWTIANSWNDNWGQEGYFLMLRGANECGIEAGIVAGMPKL